MPRRYLTPAESRDLRITGKGDQIERHENDQDFIDYATFSSRIDQKDT